MPLKKTIIGIYALCMLFLSSCAANSPSPVSQSDSNAVYDRVTKSGTIRCGYCNYNPGCMKDFQTGKLYGIGIDTMELVAQKLGLKVEWTEEVGWGTMIEGLQTNRYDMVVTPVWATADRARVVDFSKPLYFSPVCAYVKAGNKTFANGDLGKLNSSKYSIASIDGATAAIIAKEDYPLAKIVSLPQMSEFGQLLLTVSSGKVDVTFTEPADAALFLKSNPGAVEKIGQAVRVFPNCWIFCKNQDKFKNMLDSTLSEIVKSDAEDKILSKYEPFANALYRTDKPPYR